MSESKPTRILEHRGADEALAEFMQRLDQGEHVDRDAFLAAHPDLAEELRAYFADCDDVAEFTGGAAPHAARLLYPAPSPVQPAAEPGALPRLANYEVLEELARGGMGVIYKARQYMGAGTPRPTRLVALKMIRGGELASPADVRRFHNEAEAVARLDHPHIVPVYEVGQHDGQHYFSMKLIEGGSLAQRLAEYRLPACDPRTRQDAAGRAWSEAEVRERKARLVQMIATVARAVHYAHQRGLIHRDLKPANILLDAQGRPHVTDFGLAKRVALPQAAEPGWDHPLTQSGLIVGTPNYMAPEQARARKALSTAADVYSLGAIFFELLTGRPPFREATPLATLVELLDKEPPRPRALNPAVDRDLEIVCLKCLRKEPHERYGSAEALAEDLDRWRRGEPIQARAVGWWERAWKWARRSRWAAALLLLSAAALLLGLGSIVWGFAEMRSAVQVKDRALDEKDASLYLSHIALAKYERVFSTYRALAHLKRCEASRRRWEWHYLDRLCHGDLLTLHGPPGAVFCVAFHPRGDQLASGGEDGAVHIWDARGGKLLLSCAGSSIWIMSVAYSADGRALASGRADGLIQLWDPQSGADGGTLRGHEKAVVGVAFHPAGHQLASAGEDGTVRLWDLAAGQELAVLHRTEGVVSGVAFSPDGQKLAWSGWDGYVRVWDLQAGREVLADAEPGQRWTGVGFSPDGGSLAASNSAGKFCVWRLGPDRQKQWGRGPVPWLSAVAYGPAGRHLAAAAEDGGVQIWELEGDDKEWTLCYILRGHERRTNALSWNADGRRLASASLDGTVKVWDARRNPEELLLRGGHTARVTALAIDPAGAWLASASADGTLRVADPRTGDLVRVFEGNAAEVRSLAVSADGRRLIGGDARGTVQVWDAASGEVLRQWPAHGGAVCGLLLRAADRELLTAGDDGTVCVWDAASGQRLQQLAPLAGPVTAVAFSRDGRHLAYAQRQEKPRIQLLDLQSGRTVRDFGGHFHVVTGLAFDHHDRLASVSYDKTTRLWDVHGGEEVLVLARHTEPALAVAFSPDGHLLAVGGLDKNVRVYDGTPR